jgi:ribosome-binding factor A
MVKRVAKAPSQRQLRVGEELRHALAAVIERGELRDPDLAGAPLTVTEVRIGPDLRHATAFVVPLGGGDVDVKVDALNRARPFLRRKIAAAVRLKFVPDLVFEADTSFDYAKRIDELLKFGHEHGAAADDGETEDAAEPIANKRSPHGP